MGTTQIRMVCINLPGMIIMLLFTTFFFSFLSLNVMSLLPSSSFLSPPPVQTVVIDAGIKTGKIKKETNKTVRIHDYGTDIDRCP